MSLMNEYFNEQTVLNYIKTNLGVPFNILEFDDDFLINEVIVNHNYLKEFSAYFPKEEHIPLVRENSLSYIMNEEKDKKPEENKNQSYLKEVEDNIWLIEPKDGSEILGVKRIIHNSLHDLYQVYDVMHYSHPTDISTYNLNSSMLAPTLTYKFTYPNKLQVFGLGVNFRLAYASIAVCETVHKGLETIPSSLHFAYNKFCLYTTAVLLLHVRTKYENFSTPFGELNLNLNWLQDLAAKKAELIEEFRRPSNFNQRAVGIFVL